MARLQIETINYNDFRFDKAVNDFMITIPMLNIRRIEWYRDKLCIWYEIEEPDSLINHTKGADE